MPAASHIDAAVCRMSWKRMRSRSAVPSAPTRSFTFATIRSKEYRTRFCVFVGVLCLPRNPWRTRSACVASAKWGRQFVGVSDTLLNLACEMLGGRCSARYVDGGDRYW